MTIACEESPDHRAMAEPPADWTRKLVFLVSAPRSGSTWLQSMLSAHPAIGTAQESHLFNHFLGPMTEAWKHMLHFDDGRGGIGLPAYLSQEEYDDMLRRVCWTVLSNVPEFDNPLFLEKTPDHIKHVEDIQRLLPGARVIVLLRQPEDVIESILSAGKAWGSNWAAKSTLRAIRQYQHFFAKDAAWLQEPEQYGVHLVRYEALKADPTKALAGVLDHLGLTHDPGLLHDMTTHRQALHRHGEFAKNGGTLVVEPAGFARKRKGRLNVLQRGMVHLALHRHRQSIGY